MKKFKITTIDGQEQDIRTLLKQQLKLNIVDAALFDTLVNESKEDKIAAMLEWIPDDDIAYYASKNLGLIEEDEAIENASKSELKDALRNRGFVFYPAIEDIDDEEISEEFYARGLDRFEDNVSIDLVDQNMLEDIKNKFNNANWQERKELWEKVK